MGGKQYAQDHERLDEQRNRIEAENDRKHEQPAADAVPLDARVKKRTIHLHREPSLDAAKLFY